MHVRKILGGGNQKNTSDKRRSKRFEKRLHNLLMVPYVYTFCFGARSTGWSCSSKLNLYRVFTCFTSVGHVAIQYATELDCV